MAEPAAKRRRVWLKDSSDGLLYSVLLEQDVIGDDLRRAAKPKLDDEDLARVTLRTAAGALLDLRAPVPADADDYGRGAVVVEVAPAAAAVAAPAEQFDVGKEGGRRQLLDKLREEWGAPRSDRFVTPARLAKGPFFFGHTMERRAALTALLQRWKTSFEDRGTAANRKPLPAVPAAPGTGKTRFAWLAVSRGRLPGQTVEDQEWKAAMETIPPGDFKTSVEEAVGVSVTFNCDADPDTGELHKFMVGVRMLYGHFYDPDKVVFLEFSAFLQRHGCERMAAEYALQIIRWDIEEHYPHPDGRERSIVVVVDEPMKTLQESAAPAEREEQLKTLASSLGKLIDKGVHALMTSLSDVELDKAVTRSGREAYFVTHNQGFVTLSQVSVDVLVDEAEERVRRRLRHESFKPVLRECLGVPRLVEKVFLLAGERDFGPETRCPTIRALVGERVGAMSYYLDRDLRGDALLAALGCWRRQSVDRQKKTERAMRAGYLFKVGGKAAIPPLLLEWWWRMEPEKTQDEIHTLLQAALSIYKLSDEVGGAEHGPRFERQLAHLWRILTITDAVSRREAGDHQPRTIHGMLGKAQLGGASRAVSRRAPREADASFNRALQEMVPGDLLEQFEELDKPGGPTDVPTDLVHGTPCFPKDKQNPGFDFAVEEPAAVDGGGVLVLVEAKFSAEEATTAPLSQADVVDKYVKAIRGRPIVRERLLAGKLCYVIGGMREVQDGVMKDVDVVVSAIVDALRDGKVVLDCKRPRLVQLVRGSLVLLTRGHTEALLTPTLSSLPPFGEQW